VSINVLDDSVSEQLEEQFIVTLKDPSLGISIDRFRFQGVVTIQDNDDCVVTIVDAVNSEADAVAVFAVSLSNDLDTTAVSLTYRTEDRTIAGQSAPYDGYAWGMDKGDAQKYATGNKVYQTDYVRAAGTISLQASATILVEIIDDTEQECDETFLLRSFLQGVPAGYRVKLADSLATGHINNDNEGTKVSITDMEVVEGNKVMQFTVSLSHPVDQGVTVSYDVPAGSRSSASSGSFTAPAHISTGSTGLVLGSFELEISEDTMFTPTDELITLAASAMYTNSECQLTYEADHGLATIKDNEDATITIMSATAREANGFTATVQLSHQPTEDFTLTYTVDGTTNDADFSGDMEVTFLKAGGVNQQVTFTVPVIVDNLAESDEMFAINLNSPYARVVGDNMQLIIDDESAMVVLKDVSVEGKSTFDFTMTLDRATSAGFAVSYVDGSGNAGTVQFRGLKGEMFELSAPSSKQNGIVEADEAFKISVSAGANLFSKPVSFQAMDTIGSEFAFPVINGDIAEISLSGVEIVSEGSVTVATYTVAMSMAAENDVHVHYNTRNGGATASLDYVHTEDFVTFPAGSTASQTFTVEIINNLVCSIGSTFHVDLVDVEADNLPSVFIDNNKKSVTTTIMDDDSPEFFVNFVDNQVLVRGSKVCAFPIEVTVSGASKSTMVTVAGGVATGTASMFETNGPVDIQVAASHGSVTGAPDQYTPSTSAMTVTGPASISEDGEGSYTINGPDGEYSVRTVGDSCVSGDHFVPVNEQVDLSIGSAEVMVSGKSSPVYSADCTLYLVVTNSATGASTRKLITRTDTDSLTFDLGASAVEAGKTSHVTVHSTIEIDTPVLVKVSTSDRTAIAGTDYKALTKEFILTPNKDFSLNIETMVGASGEFTVTVGSTSKTIVITSAAKEAHIAELNCDTSVTMYHDQEFMYDASGCFFAVDDSLKITATLARSNGNPVDATARINGAGMVTLTSISTSTSSISAVLTLTATSGAQTAVEEVRVSIRRPSTGSFSSFRRALTSTSRPPVEGTYLEKTITRVPERLLSGCSSDNDCCTFTEGSDDQKTTTCRAEMIEGRTSHNIKLVMSVTSTGRHTMCMGSAQGWAESKANIVEGTSYDQRDYDRDVANYCATWTAMSGLHLTGADNKAEVFGGKYQSDSKSRTWNGVTEFSYQRSLKVDEHVWTEEVDGIDAVLLQVFDGVTYDTVLML